VKNEKKKRRLPAPMSVRGIRVHVYVLEQGHTGTKMQELEFENKGVPGLGSNF